MNDFSETDEVDPNDLIHKRNFLLMLSPAEGQKVSEKVGFFPPSEEVQEAETFDVITNWITLAASGAMVEISNASDWVAEYISNKYDIKGEELQDIKAAYYTFAVALISYMIQVGAIDMYIHGDISNNLEKFVEFFPSEVTVVKETDEDEQ